jgi:hypothetical protein
MNRKTLLFIIAVVASAALSARAQNLVANPGFETGDFTGWINNSGGNFVNSANAHTGTYAAWMGAVGSDGSFQQSIATTVGQLYNVSFWLQSPGGTPNDLSASFAGVTFYTIANAGAFPYEQEVGLNIMATSTSSLLLFSARQDPSYWNVDDVDVHAVVPEPGTLGLIALGALGLVGAVRKRRSV